MHYIYVCDDGTHAGYNSLYQYSCLGPIAKHQICSPKAFTIFNKHRVYIWPTDSKIDSS